METKDCIIINGDRFVPLFSSEELATRVKELGESISKDANGEDVSFLCVLNGAFMFAADLVRTFEGRCEINFIRLSSYQGTESTGKIKKITNLPPDLAGKNVVIIEDIIENGFTMQYLLNEVKKENPKSVKVVTLFNKPTRRQCEITVDYVGFNIGENFIVGYGLDYDGIYRNLPLIYTKE